MTNYEIDKKKINQEELLNDVAEKRSDLTMILLDLMDQQVVIIVIKKSIILFTYKIFSCIHIGKEEKSAATNTFGYGRSEDGE